MNRKEAKSGARRHHAQSSYQATPPKANPVQRSHIFLNDPQRPGN